MTILIDPAMKNEGNIAIIEAFINEYRAYREEETFAECLKAWEVGSREWEQGAILLFKDELLYPLSHIAEFIRRYKRLDDYIDHISLIGEPEMVKRETLFHSLKAEQERNAEGVTKVLYYIYKEDNNWDTLDSALKADDLRRFEEGIGSGESATNLRKITNLYQSIVDCRIAIYRGEEETPSLITDSDFEPSDYTTLEEQKNRAKGLLSICAKMMLSAKEEEPIKRLCQTPLMQEVLSFEGWRYYCRIRTKKAATLERDKEITAERERGNQQPATSQPLDLYTRQEVIDLLNISPTTLWNWGESDILKPTRIGRRVYFLKSEVEDVIKSGRIKKRPKKVRK